MAHRLRWTVVLLCLGPLGAVAADMQAFDGWLARYREVVAAGGWGELPPGPAVRPGERHDLVVALRARLAAEGTPSGGPPDDPRRYDPALRHAVETFQRRHGLAADGVVGPRTRVALDVPARTRVAQLERVRRQRLRPSPRRRWIRVNVPGFTLTVLDGDRPVLEMAVIVGRASRPTPLIEGAVSSVVLNPSWTVPPDLAHVDLLPKIRRDPGYLAARGIDVYESWAPGARRLDPRQVDWQGLGRGIEALALRQRPGPGNGLGRFLFGIADEYDVYLHDTPARALFDEEVRAFSSGCIRVANARALAREILGSDPAWSPARIDAAVATGDTLTIDVRDPMPIRVVYEPVWVDGAGELHVRDDVYDGPPRRIVPARPMPAPAVVPMVPSRGSPEPRRAERPTPSADAPSTAMLVPAWPAGPAMYWGAPPAVDQAPGVVRRP